MTARKHSPAHDFWHPRVEGQIRHTIGRHPEWFGALSSANRVKFVNSLAKRIVGEIVACDQGGRDAGRVAENCEPGGSGGVVTMPPDARPMVQSVGRAIPARRPIDTIPEAMKDGRLVLIWHGRSDEPWLARFRDGQWFNDQFRRDRRWYFADVREWAEVPGTTEGGTHERYNRRRSVRGAED